MTSTYFANTNTKIRKLKEDKSYPVIPKSGLNIVKRGKSKYFEGRMRFPFHSSGKKISIPMIYGSRSLNLANSVSIVIYEALRQNKFQFL